MNITMKHISSLPCRLEKFTINGKKAEQSDFGDTYDHRIADAEPYECADMQFEPKPATREILNKYEINLEEYKEVCMKLCEELCVGRCGWCV